MAEGQATGERIVVGVDGSEPSRDALRWAVRQAELTGAKVRVVLAWQEPQFYGWAPPLADFHPDEVARGVLDETVRDAVGEDAAARLDTAVELGVPAQVLMKAAQGASLLVVGSRGHGGFAGALLGSVGQHLTQHASCPVVVVRAHAAPGAEGQPTGERIVVGVDGSEPSRDALRWAVRQARLTGAEVRAVAVWEAPQFYDGWVPPVADLRPEETTRAMLEESIKQAVGDEPGVPISAQVEQGVPAQELLTAARDASLLVVGSRGHGGFAGALLGSVGQHLTHHASCPVVVIRDLAG